MNIVTGDKYTSLLHAISRVHTNIVEYLVNNGAEMSICEKDGSTLLLPPPKLGFADIIKCLDEEHASTCNWSNVP